MNILLTCAGRRNYLVQYFKKALGGEGSVFGADMSMAAPAMQEVDRAFLVPKVNSSGYIDNLIDICKGHKVDLLVSLNDLELPVIAKERKRFSDLGTLAVVSSPEVIDIAFDKWRTISFLESCGLETCATYLTLGEAISDLNQGVISFPLIVKPRWGTASISVEKVNGVAELELAFKLAHHRLFETFLSDVSATDRDHSVLIQECLKGSEYGLDLVNDLRGEPVAVFAKQKLAMRCGETDRALTVRNRQLEDAGFAISRNLRHIGNLDCDVFMTPDGPRVLELNPRFGGGYPFSHEAGANIPAALVAWAKGEEPSPEWLRIKCGQYFAKCDRLVQTHQSC